MKIKGKLNGKILTLLIIAFLLSVTILVVYLPQLIMDNYIHSLPDLQKNKVNPYGNYINAESISELNGLLENSQYIEPYVTPVIGFEQSYEKQIFQVSLESLSNLQKICEENVGDGFDVKLRSVIDTLRQCQYFLTVFNYIDVSIYNDDSDVTGLIVYQVAFECYSNDKNITYEVYLSEDMKTVYYLNCYEENLNYSNIYSRSRNSYIGNSKYSTDYITYISINYSLINLFYMKVPDEVPQEIPYPTALY